MKKAVHSSKLNPSNFVRRVLSRTSNHSKIASEANEKDKFMEIKDKPKANFEAELLLLKNQIDSLQISVGAMQNDTEKKEIAMANLANEKEMLTVDLKKQRRSNNNLKQQLEDERSYYFTEKEKYCHEMNNYKKIKQSENKRKESKEHVNKAEHTNNAAQVNKTESINIKLEHTNKSIKSENHSKGTKSEHNKTDHTNKNIKKETHSKKENINKVHIVKVEHINKPHTKERPCGKNICKNKDEENKTQIQIQQLKESLNRTLEANYNLSVKFLRMKNTKLSIKTQLDKLKEVHDKAMHDYRLKLEDIQKELDDIVQTQFMKAIPPSNKKYLQIIKQNGSLLHENLILQLEVDRLNLELERMKMMDIRNDTNRKLKFIHHAEKVKCLKSVKENKDLELGNITERKSEMICSTRKDNKKNSKQSESQIIIKKIFEKDKNNDIPSIKMLPSEKIGQLVKDKESILDVPKINSKYELMTVSNSNSSTQTNDMSFPDNETEITYYTSLKCCTEAVRTQSAPEIVQSINTT